MTRKLKRHEGSQEKLEGSVGCGSWCAQPRTKRNFSCKGPFAYSLLRPFRLYHSAPSRRRVLAKIQFPELIESFVVDTLKSNFQHHRLRMMELIVAPRLRVVELRGYALASVQHGPRERLQSTFEAKESALSRSLCEVSASAKMTGGSGELTKFSRAYHSSSCVRPKAVSWQARGISMRARSGRARCWVDDFKKVRGLLLPSEQELHCKDEARQRRFLVLSRHPVKGQIPREHVLDTDPHVI
eukprot:2928161-Pleurochrysis_carterae.AAC.2